MLVGRGRIGRCGGSRGTSQGLDSKSLDFGNGEAHGIFGICVLMANLFAECDRTPVINSQCLSKLLLRLYLYPDLGPLPRPLLSLFLQCRALLRQFTAIIVALCLSFLDSRTGVLSIGVFS